MNWPDSGTVNSNGFDSDVNSLQAEVEALRSRLSRLSEASLRISQDLDFDAVMHEVVESARSLTDAKYGVLLTYSESGTVKDVVSSGITDYETKLVGTPPVGRGLLGYLNEVHEPLRISDISRHPMSVGFPKNHPPMKSFLGMRILHHGEHLGNIFLTEKSRGQEFTVEDEETLVMFASQAGQAISNARRYEEVNRAKADLETLIDISPTGVAVYDAKSGAMVSYNQEMQRIVGDLTLPANQAEPLMDVPTFRRADGRAIPLAELPVARVMLSGETVRAEEVLVDFPDGRSITTLINAAPIFAEAGDLASVVVTVQDIAPLEDLEKIRAEFLGLVSQELRKPLAAIKGSAAALEGILRSLHSSESLQLLRIIDQQADLMRSQINSLIELTQIEAGTLSISPEPLSVAHIIELSSREFQRTHAGAVVDAKIPSGLPPVMADRERLSQVLHNLYAQVARISPMSSSVLVSASLLDFYVSISVSFDRDAAPGAAFVGRLIYPLESGTANSNPDYGDHDLAFAYCRGIVEAHGGRIRAERGDRGYGMVYTFTLPSADEATSPASEPRLSVPAPVGLPEQTHRHEAKILLAVPDTRTMATVRKTLSNSNYPTISTYDLGDIERLMACEEPDLIVLDLNSPEVEGLRLTQRLTTEYNIPVIVLSGKGGVESVVSAFEVGADDYVVKPFSPTELVARIKSSLRKRATLRQRQRRSGYTLGSMVIDYDARTLTMSGIAVQLTATEYKLLNELSKNAGRILTQDELLHRVWGPEYSGEPQLLRSYVKSLRQKLGDDARNPTYIFTEHGIGYRMAKAMLP